MGRATIVVPATSDFCGFTESGLSDTMAMSYGRAFARTLSEQDGFIKITLSSGSVQVIGHDTTQGVSPVGQCKVFSDC
jgi:hypothetical protein